MIRQLAARPMQIPGGKSVMNHSLRTLGMLLLAASLSACGSFLEFFSSEVVEKPAELQDFAQEVRLEQRWKVSVGDGQGDHHNTLTPAIDGDYVYAASADGTVMAINRVDGSVRWRVRTGQAITGATGTGSGMVLFGTQDARVVALDQTSGREIWSTRVSSEVLAPPQGNGRIVVVQTIDGKLIGLEPVGGEQRWIYESTVPPLSLRGSSKPLLAGNTVVAGFSNGTIVAVDAGNGLLQWEERVAIPQGRYDIERVIDIDGDLLLANNTVFAASYQGNLMGFDLQSGRIVWGMPGSSYHGLAQGFGNIYYVNARSEVIAIRSNTDQVAWENDQLSLRQLTAPLTFSNYVAVGDFEGYVHLLSQIDGHFVSRTRVDRSGIRGNLITDGSTLYVFGNSGTLAALSLR